MNHSASGLCLSHELHIWLRTKACMKVKTSQSWEFFVVSCRIPVPVHTFIWNRMPCEPFWQALYIKKPAINNNSDPYLYFWSVKNTTSVHFMTGKSNRENYNATFFPCDSWRIKLLQCCLYQQTHTPTLAHACSHTHTCIQIYKQVLQSWCSWKQYRSVIESFKRTHRGLTKINFRYVTLLFKRCSDGKATLKWRKKMDTEWTKGAQWESG